MGRKYEQIIEGEWQRVVKRGWRNACCDCNMVHVIDTRSFDNGKVIEVRMRVDRRATAALRRKSMSPMEEK